MPDALEPAAGGSYPPGMESRVAVLEQIARTTLVGLERIDRRFDALESRFAAIDRRFETQSTEHRSDFRWLVGIMLGGFGLMLGAFGTVLGVMGHGSHWL
jgi:hypothetical protein